jgi:hypothetical protein
LFLVDLENSLPLSVCTGVLLTSHSLIDPLPLFDPNEAFQVKIAFFHFTGSSLLALIQYSLILIVYKEFFFLPLT